MTSLKININLNSQNYALWSRMMKVAIGVESKGLLNHLTSNGPETDEPSYNQWEQEDLVVFSWLIQNIDPNLASDLTSFPTAKSLWDALITTYSSGQDKLQTYDLYVKAIKMEQSNMTLEELWIKMQGIWGELERRDPNPMDNTSDIAKYNKIRAEHKLFQFLNALDRKHDTIKREMLRLNPLPTAEEAYASVRKEAAHQQILGLNNNEPSTNQGIATGLAAIDGKGSSSRPPFQSSQQNRTSYQPRVDKSKLKCTRCGKSRHTIEQCFEIKGYPEWWMKQNKGKASMAADEITTTTDKSFGGVATSSKPTGIKLNLFTSPFTDIGNIKTRVCKYKNGSGESEIGREEYGDDKLDWDVENKLVHEEKGYSNRMGGVFRFKGNQRPKNNGKPTKNMGWTDFKDKSPIHESKRFTNRPACLYSKIGPKNININKPKYNKPEVSVLCQNKYSVLSKIQKESSEANSVSNNFKPKSWIFDCGATDTMTFDEKDIIFKTKPKKNWIQTANGEIVKVKSGGTIEISPTIKIPNCLYVPALSHKLLSVSHVTKELNCKVLMYPTFCILQDIRTGLLIGRGTEKGGLYYVDEVSQQGTVSLAH
ncbi:uncharacterized protein [Rutidosis leptorrhynchoides]|uniref:uncharacterized protein n=1 Tax=Rutidosis leptorrhynchoides TaxID=125765 RepID=UPI003A99A544